MSPGLRQQRSSREIDAAKRTKDGDESQNIFDTVVSEEEKTQQKDSTPSAGVSRLSDHVREYTAFILNANTPLTHTHTIRARTAQVLYSEFQNLTQETQQTRSSTFRKAYRFCHIADDVQRETSEQAHSKYAGRCQVARVVEGHRPQEDGRRCGKFNSITSLFFFSRCPDVWFCPFLLS